jgi:hypothetical protein
MVVGFNHNFRYKGEVYHIQTEDSGVKSPNIVTLLYQGGTILGSKKTSYADIAKVDNLEQVVEEEKASAPPVVAPPVSRPLEPVRPAASAAAAPSPLKPAPVVPDPAPATAVIAPAEPATTPVAVDKKNVSPAVETSLDEVILSYLMGDD